MALHPALELFMIRRHAFKDDRLEEIPDEDAADWIDLSAPTEEEINHLGERYILPSWFLRDPLDAKERPRLDSEGLSLLIIVRLSVPGEEAGPAFSTVPVGLILAGGKVFTICAREGLVLKTMAKSFERRRRWSPALLIFALFLASSTAYMRNLQSMEDSAEEAEKLLTNSFQNEELLGLLRIEKALIANAVALKSNHNLMVKFLKPEAFEMTYNKAERDLLDDALTETQQAIYTAEIFGQILGSMGDAFGSIISNNLNKVMKFLTGVTIILMVPTIIAGLYGMNVGLPFADSPWAFAAICLGAIVACLVAAVLFIYRRWI